MRFSAHDIGLMKVPDGGSERWVYAWRGDIRRDELAQGTDISFDTQGYLKNAELARSEIPYATALMEAFTIGLEGYMKVAISRRS